MGKEVFVDLLRLESSVYVHTMYSEYSNSVHVQCIRIGVRIPDA